MKTNRGNIMVSTTIETKDGWTRMVYHGTCVAEYAHDGVDFAHVKLNTGGYFTKTTKKRMNQFAEMFGLPFRVWCKAGVWYAEDNGNNPAQTPWVMEFNGNTCEFTVQR